MGITVKIEKVTPDKAEKWLGAMAPNRGLRQSEVNKYALVMERGEWRLSGEAVKFNEHGALVDGQHRLKAVVQSGVSVDMAVVRGIADEDVVVLDTGIKRTLGDVLKLRGEPSPILLAATLITTLQLRTAIQTGKWPTAKGFITNDWALQLLEDEPGIRESVKARAHLKPSQSGVMVAPSVLAAAHYHLSELDDEDAEEFFYKQLSGIGVEEWSAVFRFRRRFAPQSVDRPNNRRDQLALLFKTWNYWRDGREVSQLMWKAGGKKPEPFPVPK